MAGAKNSRLEVVIAIGTVVFMFLLIGFINLGETNVVSQVFAPESSAEEPAGDVSELGPVELRPAISEFTVMGG